MRARTGLFRIATGLLALGLAGCTTVPNANDTGTSTGTGSSTPAPTVFSFGTAATPSSLDPALASDDLDSLRITRQIFEGLVTVDPNNGSAAPALATSWKSLEEGDGYQFALREGVQFQDGTAFDAAAVCANFERWFNYPAQNGSGQSGTTGFPTAFQNVFKAFANDAGNSVYQGCSAPDPMTAMVSLSSPLTGFIDALTSPAFGIASPAALKDKTADVLDQTVGGTAVSAFGLSPVGTGPYQFSNWEGSTVTLVQNPGYWGTDEGAPPQIETIEFIAYPKAQNRLQALLRGDIDGYDSVTTANLDSLVRGGFQVLQRDPFSVMYLGINQSNPVLADADVRQAAAMAIDKESLVKNYFFDGSAKTGQFIPPKLSGFNNQVSGPSYNQSEAKRLLAESGYQGEELKFYYPLDVSRPYLPVPEKIYADISAQLTAVGFNIKPVPIEWSKGYLNQVSQGQGSDLFLLGTNGLYADPDNFLGPLFGAPNASLNFKDPQLIREVNQARTLPAGPERSAAYQELNRDLAESLPAIPIAFPISAVALSPKVSDFPISPVLNEVFTSIKIRP